jgi:uncharacterized protein (TIGR02597 family)
MNSSSCFPVKKYDCASSRGETNSIEGGRGGGYSILPRLHSRNKLIIMGAAALITRLACAQTHVATAPVGFTTVTIPAGEARALSLPLNNFPVYSGVISSLSGNTIQTLNANWSTSFGPFESNPHVVRFLSGKNKGGQFRVLANTQETLTLNASNSEVAASLSAGDRYDILPVATLQSLFGSNAPGLMHNTNSNLADNVVLRGAFGWLTYYNDGAQWLRQGGGYTSQNTVAVLPERGFLLVRRGYVHLMFTVAGAVPVTNLRATLPAGKVTAFGNRFPADLRLSDLKLNQIPEWVANSEATAADCVLIYENSGWRTYYHNGIYWLSEEFGLDPQDPIIALGTSVLIARLAGTDAILDQAPPY